MKTRYGSNSQIMSTLGPITKVAIELPSILLFLISQSEAVGITFPLEIW